MHTCVQSFDFMADVLAELGDPSKRQNGSGPGAGPTSQGSGGAGDGGKSWGPGPVRLSSWRKVGCAAVPLCVCACLCACCRLRGHRCT